MTAGYRWAPAEHYDEAVRLLGVQDPPGGRDQALLEAAVHALLGLLRVSLTRES